MLRAHPVLPSLIDAPRISCPTPNTSLPTDGRPRSENSAPGPPERVGDKIHSPFAVAGRFSWHYRRCHAERSKILRPERRSPPDFPLISNSLARHLTGIPPAMDRRSKRASVRRTAYSVLPPLLHLTACMVCLRHELLRPFPRPTPPRHVQVNPRYCAFATDGCLEMSLD
jgi:hypothetical protein